MPGALCHRQPDDAAVHGSCDGTHQACRSQGQCRVGVAGAQGSRQFGAVNRFGRKAVEELIAKIGASAFFIQKIQVQQEDTRTARKKAMKQRERETEEVETVALAKAEIIPSPVPHPEADVLKLEPVAELDLDKLFGGAAGLDADDLFSMDSLEEIASQNMKGAKGKLGWDQAREIGIIPE